MEVTHARASNRPRRTSGSPIPKVVDVLVVSIALLTSNVMAGEPPVLTEPHVEIELGIEALQDSRGGIIAAHLTGGETPELLVTTPGKLIAVSPERGTLWSVPADVRLSSQAEVNGLPGHHGPGVQAGDVDGDGQVEVVFVRDDGALCVHEGATGNFLWAAVPDPPAPGLRWEKAIVANLRGDGDTDVLLQACDDGAGRKNAYRIPRHLAAFSVIALRDGVTRPNWQIDDYFGPVHSSARVADLDGDGRDEVLGGTILSPDGRPLATIPLEPLLRRPHLDAIYVERLLDDRDTLQVIALEEGGDNRVFVYDHTGPIWVTHHLQNEPQNAAVARTAHQGLGGKVIWCRSRHNEDQRPFVFDTRGQVISEYALNERSPAGWTSRGVEVITPIHWDDSGGQLLAAKERHRSGDVALFHPVTGEFVLHIETAADRLYVADVLGDWREEIIVLSGKKLQIYSNDSDAVSPERPRLWSVPHYQRNKMTWNYYAP